VQAHFDPECTLALCQLYSSSSVDNSRSFVLEGRVGEHNSILTGRTSDLSLEQNATLKDIQMTLNVTHNEFVDLTLNSTL